MITISSHVLDSIRGDHAAGIRVSARRVGGERAGETLFERSADAQGRIRVELDVTPEAWPLRIELRFDAAGYFASASPPEPGGQRLEVVVVQLCLGEADTACHVPLVLSPHAYTVWCSAMQEPPSHAT